MRRAVRILIVLALAWSSWWGASAWGLRQTLSGWFEARAAEGWQADFARMTTGGFPLRHLTRIEAPALADPATGVAWQADALAIESGALWPGHVILRFPQTEQRLSWLDQTWRLIAQDMRADLRLRPGVALEVQRLSLGAGPWSVVAEDGDMARAETLVLEMVQDEGSTTTYALRIGAEDFSPGARLREAARISATLPEAFGTFALQAQVSFDKPWDRSAIETARPQPRQIRLRLAEAVWGDLALFAAGEVTVDADGVPEGEITIKAENWRQMVAMAESSGALPRDAAEVAVRTFTLLERLGGNPDALDVRLSLRRGFVTLGPIPLGPAPRLILH